MADQNSIVRRQKALAKWIGNTYHDTPKLIPIGRHSSFPGIDPVPRDWCLDMRLHDIAFLALSQQLIRATKHVTGGWHIIDHAWLVGFESKPHEPWAFVTEPYIDEAPAKATVKRCNDAVAGWRAKFYLLSADASSWNPGNCLPIVGTFEADCFATFIRKAATWMINRDAIASDTFAALTTT